jgi:hypothetical protein
LAGPFASAFLLGRVQNHFNQGIARFRILVRQDVGGDVDQVTAQLTFAPLAKHSTLLRSRHAQTLHECIGFANHLHVGIFNAVVDHLHKVTGTAGAHPFAAGLAIIGFGGNGLQKRTHQRPSF